MHTPTDSMCALSNPHLSFAAGFGTFFLSDRLPGFIGPFPPPLLIRLYAVFGEYLTDFFEKVKGYLINFSHKCSQFPYGLFCINLLKWTHHSPGVEFFEKTI